MICTFECTFCNDCVDNVLFSVCPNCGEGFEKRLVRPANLLEKYPVSTKEYLMPINNAEFKPMMNKYKNIPPGLRQVLLIKYLPINQLYKIHKLRMLMDGAN
jgi:hypothetical protein